MLTNENGAILDEERFLVISPGNNDNDEGETKLEGRHKTESFMSNAHHIKRNRKLLLKFSNLQNQTLSLKSK